MSIENQRELRLALWVLRRVKDLAQPMNAGDRALLLHAADRVRDDVKRLCAKGIQLEMGT